MKTTNYMIKQLTKTLFVSLVMMLTSVCAWATTQDICSVSISSSPYATTSGYGEDWMWYGGLNCSNCYMKVYSTVAGKQMFKDQELCVESGEAEHQCYYLYLSAWGVTFQAGDEITYTSSTGSALYFTGSNARSTDHQATAVENETNVYKYTVATGDGICGQNNLCLWAPSTEAEALFCNIKVTRTLKEQAYATMTFPVGWLQVGEGITCHQVAKVVKTGESTDIHDKYTYTYNSSDPSVVSVDAGGNITALKENNYQGVTITVTGKDAGKDAGTTYNDVTGYYTVVVTNDGSFFKVNPSYLISEVDTLTRVPDVSVVANGKTFTTANAFDMSFTEIGEPQILTFQKTDDATYVYGKTAGERIFNINLTGKKMSDDVDYTGFTATIPVNITVREGETVENHTNPDMFWWNRKYSRLYTMNAGETMSMEFTNISKYTNNITTDPLKYTMNWYLISPKDGVTQPCYNNDAHMVLTAFGMNWASWESAEVHMYSNKVVDESGNPVEAVVRTESNGSIDYTDNWADKTTTDGTAAWTKYVADMANAKVRLDITMTHDVKTVDNAEKHYTRFAVYGTMMATDGTIYTINYISKDMTPWTDYEAEAVKTASFYLTPYNSDINGLVVKRNLTSCEINIKSMKAEKSGDTTTYTESTEWGTSQLMGTTGAVIGNGNFLASGGTVTFAATPAEGKYFDGWYTYNSETGAYTRVSANQYYTANLTAEYANLIAVFTDEVKTNNTVLGITEDVTYKLSTEAISGADGCITATDFAWAERTVDGQDLNLYNLTYPRSVTATVQDQDTNKNEDGHVFKFEILMDNDAALKSDSYIITITDENDNAIEGYGPHTITLGGTGVESSGIFDLPKDKVCKITLSRPNNAEGSIYPYEVKFYTTTPAAVLKNDTCNVAANNQATSKVVESVYGGKIKSIDTTNLDTSIAEVTLAGDNTLSVTGKKVGTTTVDLTIEAVSGQAKETTLTYTIYVNKTNAALLFTPDLTIKKVSEVTANTTVIDIPTLTLSLDNGTPVVLDAKALHDYNISFSTDNNTYGYIDATTGKYYFTSTPAAGTNIIVTAYLYETDEHLAASATYTIHIAAEKGAYHQINADVTGSNVPAIRSSVALDDAGSVMYFGGYKYNRGRLNNKSDSWKDAVRYTGVGKTVNDVDGFRYSTQGAQNPRNELEGTVITSEVDGKTTTLGGSLEWYATTDVKSDGSTNYAEYERATPFTLPVRGAYLKIEPVQNGEFTVYVMQNGNLNIDDNTGALQSDSPLATNPRVYYWLDEEGWNLSKLVSQETTYGSVGSLIKQPNTIGYDASTTLTYKLKQMIGSDGNADIKNFQDTYWKTSEKVSENLVSSDPEAQKNIPFHGGHSIMQKAFVKYTLPVKAGKSYYFFANGSKVGYAGLNFVPEATSTMVEDELILNPSANNITHTPGTYKKATLKRWFKKDQWSTICLPFNVTEKQVEEVFGIGTQLAVYNGLTTDANGNNTLHLLRHVDQNILPGQPYFIRPTFIESATINQPYKDDSGNWVRTNQDTTNVVIMPAVVAASGYAGLDMNTRTVCGVSFTNVTIPSDISVKSYSVDDTERGYTFVGALTKESMPQYSRYINNNNGKLTRYTGSSDLTFEAYGAFLKPVNDSGALINSIGVGFSSFEGSPVDSNEQAKATLIDTVNGTTGAGNTGSGCNGVFDFGGHRIAKDAKNLPSGAYIINNMKVVVE